MTGGPTSELLALLDSWRDQPVSVRVLANGDVLVAVFSGRLGALSEEKAPSHFWPVHLDGPAAQYEKPGIYAHPELLAGDPTIDILGSAATGREAVERTRRLDPDVVVMDVRMPDLNGIEATRELTQAAPRTRVLILTTFEQDDYIFGALRAGASGFLLKRTRPEELIAAVHTIAAGESLLSPSVTRRVIDRMAQQPQPDLSVQAKLDELTPREGEVLELIARGLPNREIARELVVEESTIRTHVKRILMKLGLRDRVQIVIFAYETGVNRPAAAPDLSPP